MKSRSMTNEAKAPLVVLNQWIRQIGVSSVTAWRWRRAGWLETVNIAGRVYVTDEGIENFKRRARAGEFAVEHKVPQR